MASAINRLDVAMEQTSPPPSDGKRPLGRNMPVAIAVGLVLAGTFLGTLAAHPYAFLGFIALLIVIALFELDSAFRAQDLRPATPVAIGAGLVMLFGSYEGGTSAQALGLVLAVVGTFAWLLADSDRRKGVASAGATLLAVVWVPFLASFIGLVLARPDGRWYVVAAVATSVFNDVGAFGFGMRFGRHKMAPSVSPAKSWEGFAGGLVSAVALAAVFGWQLPELTLLQGVVFGLVVALASTVGDLAESMVKRDLDVKDLGRILPGHGGIMDRADALIFALPAAHFVLVALGH